MMLPTDPYRFLTPIELDDPHDDSRYPRLTSRGEVRFVPEAGDGTQRFFAAEHFTISNRSTGQTLMSADDVRLVCCLTDTRLVVTLRDFATRAEWAGLGVGMAVAAAINHRNRKAAARDQAGYEAAMQLRLQWVSAVSAGCDLGLLRSEVIVVHFNIGQQENFSLGLRLVKGGPTAAQLGSDTLRLTAEHWLRTPLSDKIALDPNERSEFEKLRSVRLNPGPKQTVTESTPCYLALAEWSARAFLPKASSS